MPPHWLWACAAWALKQVPRARFAHASPCTLSLCAAAKNLVLSGFRLVAVHDDDVAQPSDLAAQARLTTTRRFTPLDLTAAAPPVFAR